MKPSNESTLVKDPNTGAMKGSKLARFDLMPTRAIRKVQLATPLSCEIEDLLWDWSDGYDYGRDTRRGELVMTRVALYCLSIMEPHGWVYVAQVYGFGCQKYAPRNWEKGYAWSLSFTALMRHLWAFWAGEFIDPESKLPHVAHAAWHCLAILTWVETHPELDDRPNKPGQIIEYDPKKDKTREKLLELQDIQDKKPWEPYRGTKEGWVPLGAQPRYRRETGKPGLTPPYLAAQVTPGSER